MTTRNATISDVARLAAVSTSTVSNVLNDRLDQMRPGTVARVRDAIDALSYAPHGAARQLATGHAPLVGLLVPSVANPFWGAFAQHAEEAALALGYQILLCNAGRDPVIERRYADALWASGARGIILGSSPLSFAHLHTFTKRGMHVVAFDRQMRGADAVVADSVGIDNVLGAETAVRHLIECGHRRIGFVTGPLRTVSRLDRLEGYRHALLAAGMLPDPALIWEGTAAGGFGDIEGAELGYEGALDLLRGSDPPTALLAINDLYALGVYAGIRERGGHIPEDIAVVGFDDIPLARVAAPPLTTVRQPLQEMLRTVVGHLKGRIEGTRHGPPEHLVVVPELIVRGSTAPHAGKAA